MGKAIASSSSRPAGSGSEDIVVGRFLLEDQAEISIHCADPEYRRHASRPWMIAWLAKEYGLTPNADTGEQDSAPTASIPEALLTRHALLCGSSGSGKTRLMQHLLAKQLEWGLSLVAFDPKKETLRRLLSGAKDAGIPKEKITLLIPSLHGEGCPGWNPIIATDEVTLAQAVANFVSVLASGATSWGPRLQDLLSNACLLMGSHNLTLFELVRFLQRPDYRQALLMEPLPLLPPGDTLACEEALEYFQREFCTWSAGEQAQAAAPVVNKIRALLQIPFLRALFCGKESRLDLPALWREQRVILIHLDAGTLGDDGTRLLSGLLIHQLYRTATRAPGGRNGNPVILALDELGLSERFSGKAICDILAAAREYRLRLVAACQHLGQLSGDLSEALLTSTAVRFFFRLGLSDAKMAASALAAGRGGQIQELVLEGTKPARGQLKAPCEVWRHPVLDTEGHQLAWSETAQATLARREKELAQCIGSDAESLPVAARQLRMLAVASGLPRVYVQVAGTQERMEAGNYVRGLHDEEVELLRENPVQLAVSFPRLSLRKVERSSESEMSQAWLRRLLSMPVRNAVLWMENSAPGLIEVVEVRDVLGDVRLNRFEAAVLAASGVTAETVAEAYRERRAKVEALAGVANDTKNGSEAESATARVTMRSKKDPRQTRGKQVKKPTPQTLTPVLPAIGEVADDGSIA